LPPFEGTGEAKPRETKDTLAALKLWPDFWQFWTGNETKNKKVQQRTLPPIYKWIVDWILKKGQRK
jgi:hypothetical protein